MNITPIQNGVVLDHITAGRGMELYELLSLSELPCSVALIINAASEKNGRKDIIKIDSEIDLNFDLIGYADPGATVNLIRGGAVVEKKALRLPERLTDVIRCGNPRCITSTEQGLRHVFVLSRGRYRCLYCETASR